jgi:threonine/homoserine/homoserine lactone efflux protein
LIVAYLIRGFILGLSIAAPVGPIGILCIHRTLSEGRRVGFISGLGAATADAIYGSIAAFGLTIITNILINQRLWFHIIGGLFLFYLGITTIITKSRQYENNSSIKNIYKAYISTVLLTLTNPTTILSFAAIFAGTGIIEQGISYLQSSVVVLGVFLGSAFWWFLLSGFISMFQGKINDIALSWVNRISGIILFGFGIYSIISLI